LYILIFTFLESRRKDKMLSHCPGRTCLIQASCDLHSTYQISYSFCECKPITISVLYW
jgi:hypothetical protein